MDILKGFDLSLLDTTTDFNETADMTQTNLNEKLEMLNTSELSATSDANMTALKSIGMKGGMNDFQSLLDMLATTDGDNEVRNEKETETEKLEEELTKLLQQGGAKKKKKTLKKKKQTKKSSEKTSKKSSKKSYKGKGKMPPAMAEFQKLTKLIAEKLGVPNGKNVKKLGGIIKKKLAEKSPNKSSLDLILEAQEEVKNNIEKWRKEYEKLT